MQKLIIFLGMLIIILMGCADRNENTSAKEKLNSNSENVSESVELKDSDSITQNNVNVTISDNKAKPKVTFVELGSVNCIPCKQMQPVMKAIEEKYGDQVNVVFYDVWKPEQKKYAQEYGIKLIPTQIFLDENGKEFHRHEGFYPEKEISKILESKGLKPNIKKG